MIDPTKRYAAIYGARRNTLETDAGSSDNQALLQEVKAAFPEAEIPYIDMENLSPESRAVLDTSLYFPHTPKAAQIASTLNTRFRSGRFTYLGPVTGQEISDMLAACVQEVQDAAKPGHWYRVRSGHLKNKTVQIVRQSADEADAEVLYEVFGRERREWMEVSNLEPTDPPTDPYKGFINLLDSATKRRAVIVDGGSELSEAMFGYNTVYARPTEAALQQARDAGLPEPELGPFCGGTDGFYYTLLRWRERRPDYEMHVVFDDETDEQNMRVSNKPEFREAYRHNQRWLEQFILHSGFHLYRVPGKRAGDLIASLTRTMIDKLGYDEVIVFSKNPDFYQLVSERVRLSLPKVTSRDHPLTHGIKDTQERFGIRNLDRLNWLRAMTGDLRDESVIPINTYNKQIGHPHTQITRESYLSLIEDAESLEGFMLAMAGMEPFRPFIRSGTFLANLSRLTLDRTVLDGFNSLSSFAGTYDAEKLESLMRELTMFKELESFPRILRILLGIW